LAIITALVLAGCGSSHQYRVKADYLDVLLNQPRAEKVLFASSLDGFQLHPAEKKGGSTWTVTVAANQAFTYFYIIDGALFIPSCKLKQLDDFGSKNCVYLPEL